MKLHLRGKFILALVALLAVTAPIMFTVRADDDDATFRARLTGFGEVPPKLVNGQGKFTARLSDDGTTISWTLTWTGLSGPAQVAHIHFGQPQNVGTPVVFFCGGGTKPAPCPDGAGHSATLRSEEHTSELQSLRHLVCRLLLEKEKTKELREA